MKPSSNNTSKRAPIEEYNQLVDELKDMHPSSDSEESGGAVSSNVVTLKSRAQKLLIWITRHQNDMDRHGLADICKEGRQTVMDVLKAENGTDAAGLETALWELEARQMACEEAFTEDLQGLKSISQEIVVSLNPDLQKKINFKIAKATANIYKSEDTLEGILEEIEKMHDKVKDGRVDDIISKTLDSDPAYSMLKKSPTLRKQLREHIRERIEYNEVDALVQQVKTMLDNRNPYFGRYGETNNLSGTIINKLYFYNNLVQTIYSSSVNKQKFKKVPSYLDESFFHPEQWTLYGDEIQVEFKTLEDMIKDINAVMYGRES